MHAGVEGVWAIGDIANSWQLKHVANAEATVAFWNIAHPDDLRSIDYTAVPSAVFMTSNRSKNSRQRKPRAPANEN